MALSAGRLRTRVEIMRAQRTVERGEPKNMGWIAVATVWAEVTGQNSREGVIAKVLEGTSVYRIIMRWRGDLLPDDQIRLNGPGGIDLNIKPPYDPDGRREQLIIIAETNGAQKTG
jgi:head-tail adaptor